MVAGVTTVESGGVLMPGSSIGTFTLGRHVRLLAGSSLKIDLSGSSSDMLVIGGDLSVTGVLECVTGAAPTLERYVVVTHAGTRSGAFAAVVNLPAGYGVAYEEHRILLVRSGPPPPTLAADGFAFSDGIPILTFDTVPGYRYRLEYRDSIQAGSWLPLMQPPEFPPPAGWGTNLAGGPVSIMDTNAPDQPWRYYRIKAATP
jgi:hypothetical protein